MGRCSIILFVLLTLSGELARRSHGQSAAFDSGFAPALQSGAVVYHVVARPDGHILQPGTLLPAENYAVRVYKNLGEIKNFNTPPCRSAVSTQANPALERLK